MNFPIPGEALDDRLAFVGNSGSGKTYNAGACVERLLESGARAVIVDPLGVWWGLRSDAGGKKASPYSIVIFGGPHGDLPLTENAGALIGETAATMAESCILDLSEIGTSAGERRFVGAALKALYTAMKARRVAGAASTLHIVLDEADMWAPQTIREKDGGATQLFAVTERIVRRGRVDGFIPYLITQRPAELSKSVLSQADALIAMKMTASQDRDALDGWISGQADVATGKRIKASLPALQIGEGVVWIPGRGILTEKARFPKKTTYDSSRAPKRGEKRQDVKLEPVDLSKLRDKLASVEDEAKANDPKTLKAEIAKLKKDLASKTKAATEPELTSAAMDIAKGRGRAEAKSEWKTAAERLRATASRLEVSPLKDVSEWLMILFAGIDEMIAEAAKPDAPNISVKNVTSSTITLAPQQKAVTKIPAADGNLTGPQIKVLTALAWWRAMGHEQPTKAQIAAMLGWQVKGSNLRGRLAELSTAGMISYPETGRVALTEAGGAAAPSPDVELTLRQSVRAALSNPQCSVFDALINVGGVASKEDIAAALGWEPKGSNLRGRLAELSARELISYPEPGTVALQDWVRS